MKDCTHPKPAWVRTQLEASQCLTSTYPTGHMQSLRARVIKTARYWHKNRKADPRVKTEDLGTCWQSYGHLIFLKGGQKHAMEKKILFNKWCQQNCMSISRTMKANPYLSFCTKVSWKWIKGLNLKLETLKLPKGNGIFFIVT